MFPPYKPPFKFVNRFKVAVQGTRAWAYNNTKIFFFHCDTSIGPRAIVVIPRSLIDICRAVVAAKRHDEGLPYVDSETRKARELLENASDLPPVFIHIWDDHCYVISKRSDSDVGVHFRELAEQWFNHQNENEGTEWAPLPNSSSNIKGSSDNAAKLNVIGVIAIEFLEGRDSFGRDSPFSKAIPDI